MGADTATVTTVVVVTVAVAVRVTTLSTVRVTIVVTVVVVVEVMMVPEIVTVVNDFELAGCGLLIHTPLFEKSWYLFIDPIPCC